MMKRITRFFKDIFSDDVGEKHPKSKIRIKWVIYWIVGFLLTIVIPTCLVYLEAGEFSWNVASIIWPEGGNFLYRHAYFLCGVLTIFLVVFLGYLTPEKLNGDKNFLEFKKAGRFLLFVGALLWIICFIAANIVY